MERSRSILVCFVLAMHGCSGCESADAARQGPGPVVSQLPPELTAALPKTKDGLPILIESTPGDEGIAFAIAYDDKLDDPIARWGSCLSRVEACYDTNAGRLDGCVDLIETCADDTGGKGCCPKACIAAYKASRRRGLSEDAAADDSFVRGDCVAGFAAQRDAAEVTP